METSRSKNKWQKAVNLKIEDQVGVVADRLVSIIDGARRLGVSPHYIYRLTESGKFPSVRIGRRRLVRESDVTKAIQNGIREEVVK